MRCIAIDDEPIALSIIENYCMHDTEIKLSTYNNPIEGMKAIKEEKPDLVFLDIEMNDYSGLELATELPNKTILIFTTAHAQYALSGYEVHAIDFLHKPFSLSRFESAITRVKTIISVRSKAKIADSMLENNITIKVEYQNVTIPTSDIVYIESMDNYIKINTIDERTILTKMGMKYFMELLPSKDFLRIHRSFTVAKSQIISYTKQQVKLQGTKNISLPVGRNYAEDLFVAMLEK